MLPAAWCAVPCEPSQGLVYEEVHNTSYTSYCVAGAGNPAHSTPQQTLLSAARHRLIVQSWLAADRREGEEDEEEDGEGEGGD